MGWQKYEGKHWGIKVVRIIITFVLVNFAWVFFRMPNISDAFGVMGRIFTNIGKPDLSDLSGSVMVVLLVSIVMLIFKDLRDEFFSSRLKFLNTIIVRWGIYVALFCLILMFGVLDGGQFIYGRF